MPDPAVPGAKTDATPTSILPVTVTVVGGTGSGSPLTTGTQGTTPDHQPNLVVSVISPLVAVLVRFGNSFCVSLAGSLAAGGLTGTVIPHGSFAEMIQPAIILAACIAGVGLIKDFATVFSGLEKKFPLASGSV